MEHFSCFFVECAEQSDRKEHSSERFILDFCGYNLKNAAENQDKGDIMKIYVRRAVQGDEPRILDILLQVNNVHAEGRPDIFKKDGTLYAELYTNIPQSDIRNLFPNPKNYRYKR